MDCYLLFKPKSYKSGMLPIVVWHILSDATPMNLYQNMFHGPVEWPKFYRDWQHFTKNICLHGSNHVIYRRFLGRGISIHSLSGPLWIRA